MKSYCDINYVYSVREIIPGQWFIQVNYRNANGSIGGVCKLMDELDGPRPDEKRYEDWRPAQAALDEMARLYGWNVYEE